MIPRLVSHSLQMRINRGFSLKDEPYTTKKLHQRFIITYSPKYAAYQKAIRAEQIVRAEKMVANGTLKRKGQIEDCFRTMKTEFDARPVYVSREDRIRAHFLVCFLALLHFRLLKRSLKLPCTTEQLLEVLQGMNHANIKEQGFMPVYEWQEITDTLHEACGLRLPDRLRIL